RRAGRRPLWPRVRIGRHRRQGAAPTGLRTARLSCAAARTRADQVEPGTTLHESGSWQIRTIYSGDHRGPQALTAIRAHTDRRALSTGTLSFRITGGRAMACRTHVTARVDR